MKKILFFVMSTSIISHLHADSFPVNTKSSAFTALQKESCEYDEESNIVHCSSSGVFPKIIKIDASQKQPQGSKLIGSISEDKTAYNLYSLTPAQAISQNKQVIDIAATIAQQLFNPVITSEEKDSSGKMAKKQTANPFATTSLNEKAIDAVYGSSGLNVGKDLLTYIKDFYFYFEYVVKVEYAARLIALAPQLSVDYLTILEKSSWKDFVQAMQTKAGNWDALEKKLFTPPLQPAWSALKKVLKPVSTWQDMAASDFWKSLDAVTAQSLINSTFWQNYLKYSIARTFAQDIVILNSLEQIEESIFLYIPNIEIAYYHPDFTALRNGAEMYNISILLTDAFRLRLLEHCNDWNMFKDKTGSYDLVALHGAVKEFEKTAFYKIAVLGEGDMINTYNTIANKNLQIDLTPFKDDPTLQDQLTLFSMVKILHALMHYRYNKDHLESTMAIIAKAKKNPSSAPQPSILLYSTEDYVYLDDLNHLNDSMEDNVKQQAQHDTAKDSVTKAMNKTLGIDNKKVQLQGWSDFWDDIKGSVNDVWDEMVKTGKDIEHALEKAGEGLFETVEAGFFEIEGGIAKIPGLGQVLTGLSPSEAEKLLNSAKEIGEKAVESMKEAGHDLKDVVQDLVDTATSMVNVAKNVSSEIVKDIGESIDKICNTALLHGDPELCSDIQGAFVSEYQMLVDALANYTDVIIVQAGGVLKLGANAVNLVAQTATDLIVGSYKNLGEDIKNGLETMAKDAAVSILNSLTYSFKFFMNGLLDALKFASYYIAILTRLFIDASTAIAFVGSGIGWIFDKDIDPFKIARDTQEKLSEHERTINAAITTALLLATIPLTGGASSWVVLPMIAMTVGPQILTIISSEQEDELKASEIHEQKQFLKDYAVFVDNSQFIYKQQQAEITNELQMKYNAELSNQERSVGFYQNFVNKNFEALKEQMAMTLGNWWSALLEKNPDNYGLAYADVGALYGIQTGVYELNPSQGFSLYNAGRASFSQEIAVMPSALGDQNNSDINQKPMSRNWFNQKETVPLAQTVNEVEIRFKAIYLLNSFYIGLYVGRELDVANVIKDKQAPLDFDYLAKMAVFKRDTLSAPIAFGVYEHSDKKWIKDSLPAPAFTTDVWYHLNVTLNGTQLTVKVWQEGKEQQTSTSSCTVTTLPTQKTIGVISSGASIEYQFVKPTITVTPNPKVRPDGAFCFALPKTCDADSPDLHKFRAEKDREQEAQKILNYRITPATVGPHGGPYFDLHAYDKVQILKGNFIYTTSSTHLMDTNNKKINDIVIMCETEDVGGGAVQVRPADSVGSMPHDEEGIISLVSDKVFKNDGTDAHLRYVGVFDQYIKTYTLSNALISTIKTMRQAYAKQNASVTFGTFTLQASQDELHNDNYMYTMPLLKDNKGNAIKDLDYLIFITLNDGESDVPDNLILGLNNTDMLADPNTKYGLYSFVTTNLYKKSSTTPIQQYSLLELYQRSNKLLPATVSAITAAQNAYQNPITPAIPLVKPKGGSQQSGNPSTPTGGNKGSTGDTKSPDTTKPSGSIDSRTQSASGGSSNIDFGG